MEATKLIKLSVEENYDLKDGEVGWFVECMEGAEPVDLIVKESDLHEWMRKVDYCRVGFTDLCGEYAERLVSVDEYLCDSEHDINDVLADFLNHQEGRTVSVVRPTKPLEEPVFLTSMDAHMQAIPRPELTMPAGYETQMLQNKTAA